MYRAAGTTTTCRILSPVLLACTTTASATLPQVLSISAKKTVLSSSNHTEAWIDPWLVRSLAACYDPRCSRTRMQLPALTSAVKQSHYGGYSY